MCETASRVQFSSVTAMWTDIEELLITSLSRKKRCSKYQNLYLIFALRKEKPGPHSRQFATVSWAALPSDRQWQRNKRPSLVALRVASRRYISSHPDMLQCMYAPDGGGGGMVDGHAIGPPIFGTRHATTQPPFT